ncbi:transporter substrate-binding protein [Thalassoroseus pseudoceratinae]|uniref:transporter substrate-binding protein n=1 Tax=Thalassoroseus pseudoceratinae TaxID=2713176 RepID=UPI0014223722|nr:transporter substrate-binding protein [Thalassoroseus pseudoceratinae]
MNRPSESTSAYRVGVLHSLSGVMGNSETLVAKCVELALHEINAAGGVLGRTIVPVVRDGRSRPEDFADQARQLLNEEQIDVLFGCWTSASRKALLPILHQYGGLLFYPVQYEGLEESPHVIYTGSTLNQQIEPAVDWVLDREWQRAAVIGSDYVYPRTANTLLYGILEKRGGRVVAEKYLPLEDYDVSPVVDELLASNPDIIFSTINGAANADFFNRLAEVGPGADRLPVMSFSFSETELASVPAAIGHYACWDYFSTCVAEVNQHFLPRIREYVGWECPVSSPMANAYSQVYLWKAMVEAVGSFAVADLQKYQFILINGPCGVMELKQNHHVRKRAIVGRAQENNEFEIIWQFPEMIDPEPWFGVETLLRGRIIHQALEAFPTVVDLHATLRREKEIQERLIEELNQKQKELEQARDESEAANQAKSDFLAAMSHEIRTPMNGVLGMAQLLRAGSLPPAQAEQVDVIISSGESLLTIINDILDFSKIKAGRIELEQVGFSLHDLLSETLQLLAANAHARGMEIELDIDLEMPDVRRGDPTRIRQVLTNLVSNAIKFTENGRIVVAVRPYPELDDGVSLAVQDTGIGISSDAQKKLFQPFVQADAGTTRKYGGTGLGLVICRRLVELMGGELTLHSVLGEGSTFQATIPLPQADRIEAGQASPHQTPPVDLLAGRRVFLVDDNAINLRVAKGLLEEMGVAVVDTPDPQQAWEQLSQKSEADGSAFDALIFDAMMPEVDGRQLAQKVRDLPGGTRIPIILASSAIGGESEHLHTDADLFNAVLPKPLRRGALSRALATAIAGWRPQQPESKTGASQARRILVVEDSMVNQKVARGLLEKGGHHVTIAEDGQAALDRLTDMAAFDLILMDVQMPVMNGLEATRRIRERERENGWPPWPIFALTGNVMQSEQDECLAAGMDRCLTKPLNKNVVLALVAQTSSRQSPDVPPTP